MTYKSLPPYTLSRIFRMPSWLALLSLVGLIAALVGNGWLDALSWLALGIPLGIIAAFLWIANTGA